MFTARLIMTACVLAAGTEAYSQGTVAGNCDYPDQMIANEPYVFVLSTDSIEQRSTVVAVGDRKLSYEIVVRRKDKSLASGRLDEHVAGIAIWAGCFGGVTDDGVLHPDSWEYRSVDGLMTITLFGEYVTHVQVALIPIQAEPIPRVGYMDE